MADVPISGLPTTTTPASSSLLPVVDGGVTKAITLAVAMAAGGALIDADEVTLTKNANTVSIKDGGVTNTQVSAVAAIAGTKISPNFGSQAVVTTGTLSIGTNPATSGSIRLAALSSLQFRNATNSANVLGLSVGSSDEVRLGNISAVGYQQSSTTHSFRVGGSDAATLTASALALSVANVDLSASVGACTIGVLADATAGVTGVGYTIRGADVTGTGATVGGLTRVRAGNSTSGTGGALSLRSGAGATATQCGQWTAEIGATPFISYPGTVVPATTGILRAHHSAVVIAGRDNANSNNRNLVRWGTTTDEFILADTGFTTRVLSDALFLGNVADTWLEINGGTNRVNAGFGGAQSISLGGSLIEIGATPATNGNVRLSHNMSVQGRDNANGNNRNILRWGVSANDVLNLGDTAVGTVINGSSVQVAVASSATMFEVASLTSNRDVISLFRGAAITTSQMPANTGDGVLYVGQAAAAPTADCIGGAIWFVDSAGYTCVRGSAGTVTIVAPP